MHGETGAEDVTRDDHVRLVSVHREAVHAQELRQQRVAMALHYILQIEEKKRKKKYHIQMRLQLDRVHCKGDSAASQ